MLRTLNHGERQAVGFKLNVSIIYLIYKSWITCHTTFWLICKHFFFVMLHRQNADLCFFHMEITFTLTWFSFIGIHQELGPTASLPYVQYCMCKTTELQSNHIDSRLQNIPTADVRTETSCHTRIQMLCNKQLCCPSSFAGMRGALAIKNSVSNIVYFVGKCRGESKWRRRRWLYKHRRSLCPQWTSGNRQKLKRSQHAITSFCSL